MIENIDKSTVPFCLVEERKFDWGEPYTTHHPIFKITPTSEEFSLEDSVIILGENNFKQQLLALHNVINNYEEFGRIINYKGEEFDRVKTLELINFYIRENENYVAPWDKYYDGIGESFYLENTEFKSKKLNFVDKLDIHI
jgi:hypothetical protein